MVSTAAVILFFKSGMLTGCGGTNTLSSRNPKGSSHKGLNRGTMQATDMAEESMAGIGLSPRCVPSDEGCIH